jgi:predicted nucleic acid-binding protein
MVDPRHRLAISVDEEDNRLLECAQTAKVDLLITGNRKHFPDRIHETRIITPRELLTELGF